MRVLIDTRDSEYPLAIPWFETEVQLKMASHFAKVSDVFNDTRIQSLGQTFEGKPL